MVCIQKHMAEFGIKFEGCDETLHRRPADSMTGRGGGGGIHADKS